MEETVLEAVLVEEEGDNEDDDGDDKESFLSVSSRSRLFLMYSYAKRYPIPPGMEAMNFGAIPLKNPRTPSSFAINLAIAHQPFFNCSACSR